MATQASLARVQELYVAYYGRPADQAGLEYWAGRVDEEGEAAIINAFGNSEEYAALAEGQGNATLINNIYLQAFGREADPEGLTYYAGVLEAGEKTLAEIATTIINAAGGIDQQTLNARVEAAAEYTAEFGAEADYDIEAAKAAVEAAKPGVDASDLTEPLSLEEAREAKDAGNLPAEYTLQDSVANMETAARDLYDDAESIIVVGSVDELTDGDELVDIAQADDTTYQIEDTLANIVAADDSLVDNAEEGYVLTDDTEGLIFEDAKADSEEVVVLAGAKNSDDYSYTLQDTVENLKNAEDGVVEGAESVDITDYEEGDLGGEVTVAEAILIQKADLDVDYTVKDTAENILAAQDELEGVEFTVSNPDLTGDDALSVEQATFLQNAENARDIEYDIAGTVDDLTSDNGNLLSVVSGAANVRITDNLANITGAGTGVTNNADLTVVDSLENMKADDSGLVEDIVNGTKADSELQLTDGEGEEIAEDGFDLGTLSVAEAAIVQKADAPKDVDGEDVTYDLNIEGSYGELTDADEVDSIADEDQLGRVLEEGDVTLVNDTVDGNGDTSGDAGDEGARDSKMDLSEIGASGGSNVVPDNVVSDFSNLTADSEYSQGYANYTNADGETTFTIANVASQVKDAEDNFDVFKAGITVNDTDTDTDTGSFDGPLKLNLSGNAEDSFYSADAPASEFVITAEEGNSGVLSVVGSSVSDITVKGAGDLSFQDLAFSNLETLDASKSTGDISFGNIDLSTKGNASLSVADDFTATTGSGNDTIDLTNLKSNVDLESASINTGAGDDTIKVDFESVTSLELSGGKGNDTFVFQNSPEAGNTEAQAAVEESEATLDTATITDFFRGDNTLTLEGVEGALKLGEELGKDDVNVAFADAGGNTTLTVGDDANSPEMTIELAGVSGDELAVEDGNIVIA